jgi:hypothetical protein
MSPAKLRILAAIAGYVAEAISHAASDLDQAADAAARKTSVARPVSGEDTF